MLAGRNVIVADDEEFNLALLKHFVLRLKMQPLLAKSCGEALTRFVDCGSRDNFVSAVLLDAEMEGMEELAARIFTGSLPAPRVILLISENLDETRKNRYAKLGIEHFISKPLRRAAVERALRSGSHGACKDEPAAENFSVSAAPIAAGPQLRVLLTEDNVVNQRLISRLLEKLGHAVEVAANGMEALALLDKQEFDLVIMDMQMPVMDGVQATQIIRAGEKSTGRHIPILAITANAFDEDRRKCFDAGMDGYLPKPVSAKELREELVRVMALFSKVYASR